MTWEHKEKFQKETLSDAVAAARIPAGQRPARRRGRDTFTCLRCGTRTSSGMEYCIGCGRALTAECPHCGERWRYEYEHSFCPGCGAELPQDQNEWQENDKPKRSPSMRAGKVVEHEEEIR